VLETWVAVAVKFSADVGDDNARDLDARLENRQPHGVAFHLGQSIDIALADDPAALCIRKMHGGLACFDSNGFANCADQEPDPHDRRFGDPYIDAGNHLRTEANRFDGQPVDTGRERWEHKLSRASLVVVAC
jgi:hypothetical protein